MNGKEEWYHTMNIMVTSILMAYEFEMITYTHILRKDGKESKEFWFKAKSPDCEFSAEKVAFYATKGAEELMGIDPKHPILKMRKALLKRGDAVGIIKSAVRLIEVVNGDRRTLIPENASEETKRQIAELL